MTPSHALPPRAGGGGRRPPGHPPPQPHETAPRPFHDTLRHKRAAREIVVWLRDLCDRWQIDYDEESVDNALLLFQRDCVDSVTQGQGQGQAQGGGASVHAGSGAGAGSGSGSGLGCEIPTGPPTIDDVDEDEMCLDPFSFSDRFVVADPPAPIDGWALSPLQRRKLDRDLKALRALEKTLYLSRTADPETWSTADRVLVVQCLMDKVRG